MQNYSFNQWVENKDLNEASGFGGTATPETKPYERPPPVPGRYPEKVGRALGVVSPPRQPQTSNIPQQSQRVKFTAEDLLKVKTAVSDYLGLLKSFYSQVNQAMSKTERGPEAMQFAQQVFNQSVRPHYETLKSWIKWIDEMISWLPKRESIEEENEVITEAIKVNYKNFEQMAGSIRALTQSMSGWLDALGQRTGPHFMNWARKAFAKTVGTKQYHIDGAFSSLAEKIQRLMNIHSREYQKPTATVARQAPAGTRPWIG